MKSKDLGEVLRACAPLGINTISQLKAIVFFYSHYAASARIKEVASATEMTYATADAACQKLEQIGMIKLIGSLSSGGHILYCMNSYGRAVCIEKLKFEIRP